MYCCQSGLLIPYVSFSRAIVSAEAFSFKSNGPPGIAWMRKKVIV